jgi:mannose/fructose/sorbose-specific phosphotransferase system IIA component
MIGIILITHGELSDELLKTSKLIMGEQTNVHAVSFTAKESLETLKQKTSEAIEQYKDSGCLILTDIMGGSATNVCVDLLKKEKIQIVTGVNLPMLLEAIGYRDSSNLEELAKKVQESGIRSIINLKEFFEKRAQKK